MRLTVSSLSQAHFRVILSQDKYFKPLVSSSSGFSSESMKIIRNAQAHVDSGAAFNPTEIRESTRFAKWLHANAWSKFIFVEHVFERKCRVHEFPLGDASSDVIVTCPINSPVGSRPLKTLQPSAPLARPSVAFYERETVSRESPSSFIASLPHEHTRVTPPPHRDIVLFRHSSSLSFARRREKEVL